jgi:hypothetical protein
MRPLRYSINVTLDGCCDHRAISADEELHRHAVENLDQADALLFGRVTYEMMEAAFRPPARTGARPDWNAELVRGDLGKCVQQLKRESGKGLFMGGVKLPLALAELGLIDEYEFVVQAQAGGPRADSVRGAVEACRLEGREPAGVRLGSGGDAV